MVFDDLDPAQLLWTAAGLLLLLAAIAALAEHRRTRRRDIDRPGWVPWNLIQILAFMLAIAAAALAMKV
jgi:uncharacterized membrane protein SpoIIM required for sporulation